jgi:tRNA(Ile2)-agmatinylcytidine synthase
MWLGIDDTDGPSGGCTTHTFTEVLATARALGVDLIGDPRLVRLNPNIPWRTRGNAALSARFGHGRGPRTVQGQVDGRPIWSYGAGRGLSQREGQSFVESVWSTVRRSSSSDPGTDPALVALPRRLPATWYWRAVRTAVPLRAVEELLRETRAEVRTQGSRRGIVGAAASIAWAGSHATWESISYRRPSSIGTPRDVDAPSVRAAQARFPALFLCDDPRTRRLMVTPHTRCPILYGLRSTDRSVLARARAQVVSEPLDRWMIFRTNQGSGDHLDPHASTPLRAYDSARLRGMVSVSPTTLPGGHVRFELRTAPGRSITCLAFEPTKTLPGVARSLKVGDEVGVWGGRGADPTFRLEGLDLIRLVPRGVVRPPTCPGCRRTTNSTGRGRGYRCPGCRRRFPPESRSFTAEPPKYPTGTYHPTPSARRHLAPLGPEFRM